MVGLRHSSLYCGSSFGRLLAAYPCPFEDGRRFYEIAKNMSSILEKNKIKPTNEVIALDSVAEMKISFWLTLRFINFG